LNYEVKAVICTGCHRGVPVNMLRTHSKIHHPGRTPLQLEEHTRIVQQLVSMCFRTSDTETYVQPPGRKPVDGLEVLSGFCCPLSKKDGTKCLEAFRSKSTFERHLSIHCHRRKPSISSCVSDVQTLFNQGGLQCYFSVDHSLSDLDPSSDSAYAHAVQMLGDLPKAHIPLPKHDKDRASIHWMTRWPEMLQPYIKDKKSQTSIQSLILFPEAGLDPDWLVRVREHGRRWWDAAERDHVNCSHRVSTMLRCHKE
jgi:Orsellinic acid/F9775 biosynthesis cluster protein D